ncbi:hypothetical protein LINPERHAP2_LOCUS6653 [Linum perenne]
MTEKSGGEIEKPTLAIRLICCGMVHTRAEGWGIRRGNSEIPLWFRNGSKPAFSVIGETEKSEEKGEGCSQQQQEPRYSFVPKPQP